MWRGGGMFYHRVSTRVEETDGVRAKFGEPEVPVPVESQIERHPSCLQEPLIPLLVLRSIFTNRVTIRLRKPDIPILIDGHKQGAGISARFVEILNEGAIRESVLA